MRFDFYTPTEISEILGKRLKQQRLYQNLTQAELAQKIKKAVKSRFKAFFNKTFFNKSSKSD